MPPKREDATMQAADMVFGNYMARQQTSNTTDAPQRKMLIQDDANSNNQAALHHKEPVEVILRGYASPAQQYAAINHYEQLAGRICEDYSREPPIESRRYKSELRDAALTRRLPLTKTEREKVNKIAGGEHWIKVTFESQEAASAALYASPQKILGHLVHAEPYRGMPPVESEAMFDMVDTGVFDGLDRPNTLRGRHRRPSQSRHGAVQTLPRSFPGLMNHNGTSTPESQASTQTLDSGTVSASSVTISDATVTGMDTRLNGHRKEPEPQPVPVDANLSRRIPGARIVKLLPADAALKKQPTWAERLLALIPLLGWFSGAMIGNEVPRTELGEFDMNRASLYWKIMYWLDYYFRLFSYELVSNDKED